MMALRVVMMLLVAGSLLGMYEHVQGNLELELEVRPGPP
jgi:hypothetical protein